MVKGGKIADERATSNGMQTGFNGFPSKLNINYFFLAFSNLFIAAKLSPI